MTMLKNAKPAVLAALVCAIAAPALAADYYEPTVIQAPAPLPQEAAYGGWYIRGDIDYHALDFNGADYIRYGSPGDPGRLNGDLDEAWSLGAGLGYQVNRNFRTDLTLDYLAESDFSGKTVGECLSDLDEECTSRDRSSMSGWLLLANAYAELGTYHGFTPYVGAGIGGAHIEWDTLTNTIEEESFKHKGQKDWRFAYALMAGSSYCLTKNLNLDVGYRFSRVEDGKMFGYADGVGPGHDRGFDVHEVRGGLRYQFGGGNPACGEPETIAYEPEPIVTK